MNRLLLIPFYDTLHTDKEICTTSKQLAQAYGQVIDLCQLCGGADIFQPVRGHQIATEIFDPQRAPAQTLPAIHLNIG